MKEIGYGYAYVEEKKILAVGNREPKMLIFDLNSNPKKLILEIDSINLDYISI